MEKKFFLEEKIRGYGDIVKPKHTTLKELDEAGWMPHHLGVNWKARLEALEVGEFAAKIDGEVHVMWTRLK